MIEIDLIYLQQHQINAHQFVILKLLSEANLKQLQTYLNFTDTFNQVEADLEVLYEKGFVANPPSDPLAFSIIKVTDKFRKSISFIGDPFEEFYETFPTKVLRPSGDYDYLRVDHKRSRKIYHNIVRGNKAKHEYLIKCLLAEIKDKTLKGQMSFFKRMSAWLTSESWKVYEDLVKDNYNSTQDDKTVAYGTGIE